jgi:hypothetical protein
VYSDDAEAVVRFLREHGVPLEMQVRRLRYSRNEQPEYPVLLFAADTVPFDLTVLPRNALRQAPLDRTDDRPMRRAALPQVEVLLAENDADGGFEQRLRAALR